MDVYSHHELNTVIRPDRSSISDNMKNNSVV